MNRRRLLILALLAVGLILLLVVGGLALTGGLGDVLGGPTPTPTVPPPTPQPEVNVTIAATVISGDELVEVVISNNTVPRGFQMTEDILETEFRLASEIDINVFTDTAKVVGLVARTDIYQGETITLDSVVPNLAEPGLVDYGPSSLIPQGFVAMAVPMDRQASVAYALAPGDFIDILVSFLLLPVDEQFQTQLPNNATFFLEETTTVVDEDGETAEVTVQIPFTLSPYGRFEELPTGDLAHVSPSEDEARGIHISFLIQNAKVIEVGQWIPPLPAQPPTPTPDPEEDVSEEEAAQEGPEVIQAETEDTINALTQPPYNFTILVALPPQQQIFLKHAVETNAVIDFALRGVGDGELYSVENVTLDYIVNRFNVEIPPNFTHIIGTDESVFSGFRNDNEIIIDLTPEAEPSPLDGNTQNGETNN